MTTTHLEKNSIKSEKEQNQVKIYILLFCHHKENCKLIQIKMSTLDLLFVIVAGRTPENDINESDLRYQFGRNDRDVELYSWDSWIRRLRRD